MDHPTFVRIEYWNPLKASWGVGHSGLRLMNPAAYMKKLSVRGAIARAVDPDTDEVIYTEGADLL